LVNLKQIQHHTPKKQRDCSWSKEDFGVSYGNMKNNGGVDTSYFSKNECFLRWRREKLPPNTLATFPTHVCQIIVLILRFFISTNRVFLKIQYFFLPKF
jgi:hypothetical protein